MEENLPEKLYKYRSWSDKYHRHVISKRQLFYAAPTSFKDPLDCKTEVRYDLLSREQWLQWIEVQLRKNEPNNNDEYYRIKSLEVIEQPHFFDSNYLAEFNRNKFIETDKRIGVLSLTANPENPEMWKKYADDSKGFCIGYKTLPLLKSLGGGGPVVYLKELPTILPEPFNTREEFIGAQLFCKLEKWSFEKEYRTHTFSYEPLTRENRIIEVSPVAFSELIIGENMTDRELEEVVNSIPSDISHIDIKRKNK